MTNTDKIIKEFRRKFTYEKLDGTLSIKAEVKSGEVVEAIEDFLTKALKQAEEDTIKEIYNFGLDKEKGYYDPRKSMAYLEHKFRELCNLKEK